MIARHALAGVLEALRDTPIVYLQGARQTGKSTLAKEVAARWGAGAYRSLDTGAVLTAARADPDGFVAGLPRPVAIDEAQRAPGLALAIKSAVDADRRPGQFVLTGSASVLSLPRLSDSLAGRMEIHTLWPFSQGELAGVRETFVDRLFAPGTLREDTTEAGADSSEVDFIERVSRGGYPEVHARESAARRTAWFDSYVDAVVERDVRELANIDRLTAVPSMLSTLAVRAGQVFNRAELSRVLRVPNTTLARYLALLEMTFLIRWLPAWSSNLGKRLTRAPKLLLNDTGLLTHLLGADASRLRSDRTLLGHVFEVFTTMEIVKQLGWSEVRPRPFHFRTEGGAEVDLVLEDRAGRLVGIEIKSGAAVPSRSLRGLAALADAAGDAFVRGVVLYTGTEVVPFGERFHAVPVTRLWR